LIESIDAQLVDNAATERDARAASRDHEAGSPTMFDAHTRADSDAEPAQLAVKLAPASNLSDQGGRADPELSQSEWARDRLIHE